MKATLPPGEPASSCLLFQIGETTQALSGGALQATPHAVRSTSQEGKRRTHRRVDHRGGRAAACTYRSGDGEAAVEADPDPDPDEDAEEQG